MNATVTPPALRPLGLGELLDRAVTLCVRYFVPFSLIYLAYGVPLGVVNFFASQRMTAVLESLADQIRGSGANQRGNANAILSTFSAQGAGGNGWTAALVVLAFFVAPLAAGALIDATSESYLGRMPTFARAYRVAASRWLNLIGINLLYLLAGGAIYAIVVVATVFMALAIVAIGSAAHAIGLALGVVLGVAAAIVVLAFALVVTLAYQMSFFTCVVESANFATSFARGLARVFTGIGLKRSLFVGLAYVAVVVGIYVVSFLGQAVLVGLLRSAVAGAAFTVLVAVGTAAFLTAFMTIFYFDLRVREDGLDLQLAAEAALDRPLGVS